MPCPICKKPVEPPAPGERSHAPFCSARCKLVDLGKWFTEGYAIPGPPAQPDELARELDDDDDDLRQA